MHTLIQDIRYGIRMMMKNRGFTLTVMLILAIGIGANIAIFSIVDKLLVQTMPVKNPKELVFITSVSVNPHFVSNAFSQTEYEDYKANNNVFSDIAAADHEKVELRIGDQVGRVYGEYVSGKYFNLLGIHPSMGRVFTNEEGGFHGEYSLVIVGDKFWKQRFNADPGLVGKTIKINDRLFTVIGIMPQHFNGLHLEEPTDLWLPLSMHPLLNQSITQNKEKRVITYLPSFPLIARIKQGITNSQAEVGLDLTIRKIKEANESKKNANGGMFFDEHIKLESAERGKSTLRERFSPALKLLTVAAAMILLIASINIAELMIARGFAKRKEMAIRLCIGATRARLIRQMLTESLLLAGIGGIVGILVTPWLVTLLLRSHDSLSEARTTFSENQNSRILIYSIIVTVFTGIISGIIPALQYSKINLISSLKDDNGFVRQRFINVRNTLVVAQIAPAIVVLIGAGLCLKSLSNLFAIDPGFKPDQLVIAPLNLDDNKYDEVKGWTLQRQLLDRLKSIPGIVGVSSGQFLPISGGQCMSTFNLKGRPNPLPDNKMIFDCSFTGPEYHKVLGIDIVKGRGFTQADLLNDTGTIVINEALARLLFPGDNPIGKQLTSGEIVGVSRNIKHHTLTENITPHFDKLVPQKQYSNRLNFIVRVKGESSTYIHAIRREVLALDSTLDTDRIHFMSQSISKAVSSTQMASILILVIGIGALLLVAIGLYGVTSFVVTRRTREIGVRMALGAQKHHVLKMIIQQGMLMVVIGIVTGAIGAFFAMRFLESMLFGVGKLDVGVYVIAMLILLAGGLFACWIPARRAANIDPMNAIRHDS